MMKVKTDLYNEVEVIDQDDQRYLLKIVKGNDIGLEWVDKVKCEVLRED